jgi:hypothetical protein
MRYTVRTLWVDETLYGANIYLAFWGSSFLFLRHLPAKEKLWQGCCLCCIDHNGSHGIRGFVRTPFWCLDALGPRGSSSIPYPCIQVTFMPHFSITRPPKGSKTGVLVGQWALQCGHMSTTLSTEALLLEPALKETPITQWKGQDSEVRWTSRNVIRCDCRTLMWHAL